MRHLIRPLHGSTLASALLLSTLLVGCSAGEAPSAAADEAVREGSNRGQAYVRDDKSAPNILGIALNSPDHTTLVAAVQALSLIHISEPTRPY